MRILVNGKEVKLDLVLNEKRKKSELHLKIRNLLRTNYPLDKIYEEVYVPIAGFYLDFFIPSRDLACEAHGEQHYTYNTHFFKSKLEFLQAQKRDRDKENIMEENGISLLSFKFDEENNWQSQLEEFKNG